jgi:hypothetical protein
MTSNLPTALQASGQRVARIMANVDPETLVNSANTRLAMEEQLVTARLCDRGEAAAIVELHRRQAAGEPLSPRELSYFAAHAEAAAALERAEAAREEALHQRVMVQLATHNRDDVRQRLEGHRTLRARLIAEIAAAMKPDRVLLAMPGTDQGVNAVTNLHSHSEGIVAAQMSVQLLNATIPTLETELDQLEAQVAASEKELAGDVS